jgi:hypothetical protein
MCSVLHNYLFIKCICTYANRPTSSCASEFRHINFILPLKIGHIFSPSLPRSSVHERGRRSDKNRKLTLAIVYTREYRHWSHGRYWKRVAFALTSPPDFRSATALIKKKIKFSSYIRKFKMEQLQSHI